MISSIYVVNHPNVDSLDTSLFVSNLYIQITFLYLLSILPYSLKVLFLASYLLLLSSISSSSRVIANW
jgi:hypothetical protein